MGDEKASETSGLKAAKRTAALPYSIQSKYPKLEPEIECNTWHVWSPVPGSSPNTEANINFLLTVPRGVFLRFARRPFFFKYRTYYRNPAFVADGNAGDAGVENHTTMASTRAPPVFVDPDLGLFSSLIEKSTTMLDGTCVSDRGESPLCGHQALYQKFARTFMRKGERVALCDSRTRIRSTEVILPVDNELSAEQKEAARLLTFANNQDQNYITAMASADGIWPYSRRDVNLSGLMGRKPETNSLLPSGTVIESMFFKHSQLGCLLQTDATYAPDATVLSNTVAANAAAAPDVKFELLEFKILYELVKLKTTAYALRNELKFYFDLVGIQITTLTPNVTNAFHSFHIKKGTKLVYVCACFAHQVYYTATQRKGRSMRFPPLADLSSMKFELGETPIFTPEPIDGLQSGYTASTPASFALFNYLASRKLWDEPFEAFRPDNATNRNYAGGIFPIDLTNMDNDKLDTDLKLTLNFGVATSPANANLICMTVSEAMWRVNMANGDRQWKLDTPKRKKQT